MKLKYTGVIIALLFLVLPLSFFLVKNGQRSGRVAGVKSNSEDKKEIQGIILPHHGLARSIIQSSLERVREEQTFSHIVIFGTNHFSPELYTFSTSEAVYNYPLAVNHIIRFTQESPEVVVNQQLLENEHSITLILPFVKNYFPDAKVFPLIISPQHSMQDLRKKVDLLISIMPQDTLYIASVDFSHNKMLLEALEKNKESIIAIQQFDYQTILSFKDDHMDSSVAIATFLLSMERRGVLSWETWYNTHGALLKDDHTLQGTSYVIGVFR